MRNFWKIAGLAVVLAAGITNISWSQSGGPERDPFFPAEKRPAAPSPAPRQDDWGRDPFENPLGAKSPAAKVVVRPADGGKNLTGIIHGNGVRLAILNGEILREGSRVGDKTLTDIRKTSIILRDAAGRAEELFLGDFSVEKH